MPENEKKTEQLQQASGQSALQQPDVGPMARFEALKRDAQAPSLIFQRLTDEANPETLRQIAKALGVPKGLFVAWFTTTHGKLWDAAKKVRAADLALEGLEIIDNPAGEIARDKERAKYRQWMASRFDRPEYGEHQTVDVAVRDERVLNREEMALETARNMGFLLAHGEHILRERDALKALAAPVQAETVETVPQASSTAAEPAADQGLI